jgi:hypothetical protein
LNLAIILQEQQKVILLLNKIKNSNNKLENLSILFTTLFFLNFENTIFSKFFFVFNFENNILSNSINFNEFFKVIEFLDTLQNLILFQNLNLTLQRYSKFRLYRNKFVNSFSLLFKIILLKLYKLKIYIKAITNIYYKIN